MRAIALVAMLFLPACASYRLAPALERPVSSRAELVFAGDFDAGERLALAGELDFSERLYLGLEGGTPPIVRRVTFYSGPFLPLRIVRAAGIRPVHRSRYLGLCGRGRAGAEIDLGVGIFGRIAAATHELHHARIGDPQHKAPGWRLVNGLRYATR